MKSTNKIQSVLLIVLAGLIGLSACNELPTDMGYSLITDTVQITAVSGIDSKMLTEYGSFEKQFKYFSKGGTLVGKFNEYKAVSLINFGVPDTLGFLTEDKIVSVNMFLQPVRYAAGDTNGSNLLSFSVKKIDKSWDNKTKSSTVFSNSLFGEEVASYSGSIKLQDTISPIQLEVSKKLVADWFKIKAGLSNDTIFWGIGLIPNDNSTVINSFVGEGTTGAAVAKIQVVFNNPHKNNAIDTINLLTGYDAEYVQGPAFDQNQLIIEGGRSIMSFMNFDFSSIPSYAGVLQAELILTMDRSKSYFANTSTDSLVVGVNYYTKYSDIIDDSSANKSYSMGLTAAGSNIFIQHNLAIAVKEMIKKNNSKGIISLYHGKLNTLLNTINKIQFYGMDAIDPNNRPKLKIIYSVLKPKE